MTNPYKLIDVPELTDYEGTLLDLFNIVHLLIAHHGGNAKISFEEHDCSVKALIQPGQRGMG